MIDVSRAISIHLKCPIVGATWRKADNARYERIAIAIVAYCDHSDFSHSTQKSP